MNVKKILIKVRNVKGHIVLYKICDELKVDFYHQFKNNYW